MFCSKKIMPSNNSDNYLDDDFIPKGKRHPSSTRAFDVSLHYFLISFSMGIPALCRVASKNRYHFLAKIFKFVPMPNILFIRNNITSLQWKQVYYQHQF